MSSNDKAPAELNSEAQRISAAVRPLLKAENGIIEAPADWVEKVLPEGLTPELHKASQQFDINACAGMYDAAGHVAVDHMKANAEIQSVSYKTKIGKSTTQCMFPRTSDVPDGFGKDAPTKTVYGADATPRYKVGGKGQMAAAKARIQGYAVEQKL